MIPINSYICDFYLKFYCELNFIEQYWGAAKLYYCGTAWIVRSMSMKQNVKECLNDIPLIQIHQYDNFIPHFRQLTYFL